MAHRRDWDALRTLAQLCAASVVPPGAEGVAETTAMKPFGVWLPRRSLLFFDGAAYTKCLHGIESVTEDAVDESVVNWRCAVDSRRVDSEVSPLLPR